MSSKLLLFTALYALLFVSLALGSPAQQFLSLEKDARKVFAPRFAGRYCNNGTGITCPVFCGILLCHGWCVNGTCDCHCSEGIIRSLR
ncbi:hypothetical protein QR680_015279 [Steinernema hermaphroditum]|uniref:Invertebrate defensins family profile domain-containing protein n=1 Tax=Steinernema hermaphroditum TaxID=289476 RepID=A0AA39H9B6_9BILA|nr:hypothetical protein QR680_015279 [Steinernema hermaphroditum]